MDSSLYWSGSLRFLILQYVPITISCLINFEYVRIVQTIQTILDKIRTQVNSLNGQHVHGLNRANKLLADKTVKYGQLKRIIHDLQSIDKVKDVRRYELAGGKEMEDWMSHNTE